MTCDTLPLDTLCTFREVCSDTTLIENNPYCHILFKTILYNDNIKRIKDSVAVVNDSLRKIISDNITIETLIKSQEFYSTSFNYLLAAVGIAVAVATLIMLILAAINFRAAAAPKKELNLLKIEMKKIGQELETTNEYIKEQEKNFNNMKAGLEATNNYIKEQEKNFNNMKAGLDFELEYVYEQFAASYFNLAMHYIHGDKKKNEHFHMLCQYFNILTNICLNLDNYNWGDFKHLRNFVDMYEENDLKYKSANGFLFALNDFRGRCVKTGISKGLEEANSLWNMLCEKFGETNVLKAVKDFEEGFVKKSND